MTKPNFPNLPEMPEPVIGASDISMSETPEVYNKSNFDAGMPEQNRGGTPLPSTDVYLYSYMQRIILAIKPRLDYYDNIIQQTENICAAHDENVRLVNSLFWYCVIAGTFICMLIILCCFLFACLISPLLNTDNILEFVKGMSGLLSLGALGAIISIFFIKNFYTKFTEINTEIRELKDELYKLKMR